MCAEPAERGREVSEAVSSRAQAALGLGLRFLSHLDRRLAASLFSPCRLYLFQPHWIYLFDQMHFYINQQESMVEIKTRMQIKIHLPIGGRWNWNC